MEAFQINILNIAAVLLVAYLGGTLIKRIGYPAILGELLVGIIFGPGMLGILEYSESVKVLSEFGIMLLMVYIGMKIDFNDLRKASWPGLLAATGGFVVPFFLGYHFIIWQGGTTMAALFVAIAIGVTSLATKSRILVDLNLLNTRIAYVMMAGALITDTLALVIFSGITGFAESHTLDLKDLFLIGIKIIAFFVATISIGAFVLPRLGAFISKSKVNDSTAYFTLILVVTFAYCEMAELAGMHSILGAFMAGLFLKANLFPKNISKEVSKAFYDVSIGFMAPIFFVAAGFFVDVSVFRTDLSLLISVTALAVVGKIVGTALFYLPSRNGWREGLTIGTGMNGRGAVEIIIAEIGLKMGIIDQTIFSILVFMAIFTTLTVPLMLSWTIKWLRNRGELIYTDKRKGILILGVNSVSLLMAKYLSKTVAVTMIDNNFEMVEQAKTMGIHCIHGNALNEEVLANASPENVSTFIAMTPNNQVNLLAGQLASETFQIPNISLAVSRVEAVYGPELMERFKATILFGIPVGLDKWFQRMGVQGFNENSNPVQKRTDCRVYAEKLALEDQSLLPVLIQEPSGNVRLFHSGEKMQIGEQVILIK